LYGNAFGTKNFDGDILIEGSAKKTIAENVLGKGKNQAFRAARYPQHHWKDS
jgi:hypothetical protein